MNKVKVGIDSLSFYTSSYYLDLKILAENRNINPEKAYLNLGQKQTSVFPPDEDIVTMACNAAEKIIAKLSSDEVNAIEMVLFATESGVDFSKAASTYVHRMLNLPKRCRVLELKQACYSATCGLQLALDKARQNPRKKILLLASDIARYKLNSPAESSQGGGAVAMLISADPKVLVIENESGFYTHDAMDFWRPNYCTEAFVDGKQSCELYMRVLEECWNMYKEISGRNFNDHDYFCYHNPVPKLVEMSHRRLAKICDIKNLSNDAIEEQLGISMHYNGEIGNCYTASLYLGIISLLDNCPKNLSGNRIGLYSYGSGCSGEYFSAIIQDGYKSELFGDEHKKMLSSRKMVSYDEYIQFYNFKFPEDGSSCTFPVYSKGKFRLRGVENHQRIYGVNT